jgi:hypothetical protein
MEEPLRWSLNHITQLVRVGRTNHKVDHSFSVSHDIEFMDVVVVMSLDLTVHQGLDGKAELISDLGCHWRG